MLRVVPAMGIGSKGVPKSLHPGTEKEALGILTFD